MYMATDTFIKRNTPRRHVRGYLEEAEAPDDVIATSEALDTFGDDLEAETILLPPGTRSQTL